MLAQVKPRDIVLIQFGHNDGGPLFTNRARGSLPGLGEETQEGTLPNGKSEVVHTFGWYMRKLIADVKAKGATPIVLSLTIRNMWRDGKIERGSGRFSQWSYDIAKDARVPFVDVTTMMADQFDAMGEQKVTELYPQDHTHFNAIGADMHAAVVVSGLKGLRPSPITGFLSPKGQAIAADRFSWLRLPAPANPRLPSLVLVGDSTVRNGRGDGGGGQWGWGDYLGAHFDLDKINVVNRAVGGTGVASFMALGHWDRALALLKPGDFVMIQFGHNDNGARGPLPGVGENTQERQNAATGQMETVHTFGWYLKKYIADARAEGATPIVCSLVPRKIWKEGKIARNKESHAGWAEQVAAAECAALVDLNEIIARRYDELGPDKVNPLFADEHTHTTADGAKLSAECVVAGLKGLTDDPLKTFLREEKP
jgi:lysophospholipase L1-like esterase